MDLGDIGITLVTEGEAEARAAIERYVRARDAATRSMDEAAQREVRAAEAIERAIQREIQSYESLVRQSTSLKRSYEDLVASFNPLNQAQLQYARNLQMLDAALEANVISEQQRERAVALLEQRMQGQVEAEKTRQIEMLSRASAENTREIQAAAQAYDRLLASLDPVESANQKYQRGVDTLNQAVARLRLSEEERLRVEKLLSAELGKDLSTIKANQAKEETREIERNTRAHAQLVGELERLRASVDPLVRAQQLYDQALSTTTRAVRQNIISHSEAGRVMDEVRAKMASMGHIVNQNGEVLSRSSTAWQRWARGGIQNAGYQVADFAVQVQGGTSALVAFGQQAPQLLGTFGAWGAVLGAVVAILAAFANALNLSMFETRDAEDAIQDLEGAVSSLGETYSRLVDEDLGETFGSMTERVRQLTEATTALDRASVLGNLNDSLRRLVDTTTELSFLQSVGNFIQSVSAPVTDRGASEAIAQQYRQTNFQELGLEIGYDVFQGMVAGITRSANQGDIDSVVTQLSQMIQSALPEGGLLGDDGLLSNGAQFLLQYRQIALAAAEANAEINGSAEAQRRANEQAQEAERVERQRAREAERLAESRERDRRSAFDILVAQVQSADLARTALEYGEGLTRYQQMQAQSARDDFLARVAALDISEDLRQILVETYDEQTRLTRESELMADRARETADEFARIVGLVGSISDTIANMEISNIGRAARLAALQGGASDAGSRAASDIAVERERLRDALGSSEGIVREGARQELDRYIEQRQSELAIEEQISAILTERRQATRDANRVARSDDVLPELVERVRLERQLIGTTETNREVRMMLLRTERQYSEAAIQNAIQMIESEREVIRQRQQMIDLFDTAQSSLENGLMAMVDGTKSVSEAFRDMAREIIAELYRVLVVQRIVGSFGSGTGIVGYLGGMLKNANGNAFFGGSVTPFEYGGVVNSPTLFPMKSGTGLMGEAGPEAILPLKRDSSGRLGVSSDGGSSMSVTQNLYFSASGDESVKRLIASEFPKIAEYTTQHIMRERRKGGSLKSVFG